MEEGRIGTIPKSAMGRGMSRNYALIKVRNYSRKSGHVQSGNNALLSRHSPSRLSPFVRFTPRRSTRSFISTLLRLFQRSIKRRGTEERNSIPFHDPLQRFRFPRNVSPDVRIPTFLYRGVCTECIRSSPAVSAISLGTADANPFWKGSGRQI